ncbi:MAG: glycosyltransferase [Bacteroidota bacterium]|nr:glycosyltransferase [Bacteroidota bacterium]
MNILINASNIKIGGGVQVTDYICNAIIEPSLLQVTNAKTSTYKQKFPEHKFFIVLSSYLSKTKEKLSLCNDIKVYTYDIKNNFTTLLLGRDCFLDDLIKENKVDCVITVFGPSRWVPKVRHLCGFAMAQLILRDSPFFSICSLREKFYWKYVFSISRKLLFQKCSKLFYSENKYISQKVESLFHNSQCFTITNYYNPIYENPKLWKNKTLNKFDGITLLNISSSYSYKNLQISLRVAKVLEERYPDFKFRFVFSVKKEDFLNSEYVKNGLNHPRGKKEKKMYDLSLEHFVFLGKVDLEECPSLYQQSDFVFVPTLMESFTALYPESFKMQKPLLTSDLPFAKGLCGNAAEYFSPLDAEDIAEKIYSLANNPNKQKELILAGEKQLLTYDNNTQRINKLLKRATGFFDKLA